jgi:hypothetical protein
VAGGEVSVDLLLELDYANKLRAWASGMRGEDGQRVRVRDLTEACHRVHLAAAMRRPLARGDTVEVGP